MFSWKVLWSTALMSTLTPLFLVKSAASAWNCLAKVVPLSFVPQVTVPVGGPPPVPPAPELLELGAASPPEQAASSPGAPTTAAAPRAVLSSDRRLSPRAATDGGTSEAR